MVHDFDSTKIGAGQLYIQTGGGEWEKIGNIKPLSVTKPKFSLKRFIKALLSKFRRCKG